MGNEHMMADGERRYSAYLNPQGDKRVVTLRPPKEVVAKCTMGAPPSGQKAAFARGRVP